MSQPLMTVPLVLTLMAPVLCGVRGMRGPVVRASGKPAAWTAVVAEAERLADAEVPGPAEPPMPWAAGEPGPREVGEASGTGEAQEDWPPPCGQVRAVSGQGG
jgi:hypothetical protein